MINDNNFGGWSINRVVFNWILENIPENSIILELGSGMATLELCKFYNVFSVEHNKKWLNKCSSNYIYAPLIEYNDEHGKYRWYDINILKEQLPTKYDLVIVDGPPGATRTPILYNIELFYHPIPYIIDDTNRLNDQYICDQLKIILGKNEIWKYSVGKKETTIIN